MEVGSNGGSVSNSSAGSILYLCGTGEKPTPEMIAAGNGLLAQYGDRYGQGFIRGHRESPDASTTCPGDVIMSLIGTGQIHWSGADVVIDGEAILDSGRDHIIVDGRFGRDSVRALQKYLNKYHGANLKVDGKAGHSTWRALQDALGTPVDGEVWDQSYRAEELGNGITQGWKFTGRNSDGSKMVRALQGWVGVRKDGVWFEGTSEALQEQLNTYDLS